MNMITIKIDTSGMDAAIQRFGTLTRRSVEIAQQRALIGTAKAIHDEARREMSRVFSNPTRFTLNSLTTRFDKAKMAASVETKDGYWVRADNYLQAQIEGTSSRRQKAFEKALQAVGALPPGWVAVPGERAKLDAYGNHSVSEIRQILSWFDAAERVAGSTQNMGVAGRERRRKGTRKKAGWEYFYARPGGSRSFARSDQTSKRGTTHKMQPGIYRRTSYALGSRIEPVIIFVRKAAYRQRFDLYGTARKVADREFPVQFDKALQVELAKGGAR